MKKIRILLVIIFTLLFSNIIWGDWSYVDKDLNDHKYFYDKDRVRKSGKFLYVWTLENYRISSRTGTLSVSEYSQLDCSILRYKILKYETYKNNGGEGEINNEGDFCCYTISGELIVLNKWNYPSRESVKESMLNKICEEHQ